MTNKDQVQILADAISQLERLEIKGSQSPVLARVLSNLIGLGRFIQSKDEDTKDPNSGENVS